MCACVCVCVCVCVYVCVCACGFPVFFYQKWWIKLNIKAETNGPILTANIYDTTDIVGRQYRPSFLTVDITGRHGPKRGKTNQHGQIWLSYTVVSVRTVCLHRAFEHGKGWSLAQIFRQRVPSTRAGERERTSAIVWHVEPRGV